MRICPECGHEDPICWRPAAYHPEFSYAHLDGLDVLEPELAELLKGRRPGEMVQRGPYLYWRSTRSETVRRVWVEDYKRVGKKGSWQERVVFFRQLKLQEEAMGP